MRNAMGRTTFIRADANPQVGMGHLMRCLSIADAAKGDIVFVLADDTAKAVVESRGYRAIVLHTDYRCMEEELPFWESAAPEMILVDSYFAAPSYLSALKEKALILYMDDLAVYPYPVDILVNYNIYANSLDYEGLYQSSGIPKPKLVLGPEYAPLRTMFRNVPPKKQKKQVRDVLISTGGADPEHIALKIAEANPKRFVFHILAGAQNLDRESLRRLENDRLVVHENVTDIRGLFEKMDLAVSAAGSTLYELCACGVPTITYVLADNQIPGADAFDRLGLAENLGDLRTAHNPAGVILDAVDKLSHDHARRAAAGERMQNMVDGDGARRIWSAIRT